MGPRQPRARVWCESELSHIDCWLGPPARLADRRHRPEFCLHSNAGARVDGVERHRFPGGVGQVLGTTAGTDYTIRFSIYDIGSLISKINFTLNGTQLGTNLNAQGGSIVGGTTKGQTYNYNFTAVGSDLISFAWPGPGGGPQVSILADVQVVPAAPVPEPGTWAAAALLVSGAAFMRWRKGVKSV